MVKNKSTIIIGVYSHPEALPPTLNAITELSKIFTHIYVVYRPFLKTEWEYPNNVTLIPSGNPLTSSHQENSPLYKKVYFFIQFTWKLLKTTILYKPKWILVYDHIPTLSIVLIKRLISNKINIWYHSHDVVDSIKLRKYSVSWFAHYYETYFFNDDLRLFTLPSKERIKFFPLTLKQKFVVIPNYPSLSTYFEVDKTSPQLTKSLKMIYQGTVSPGHGLEEISNYISSSHKDISLHIAGNISKTFANELIEKIGDEKLQIHGFVEYKNLSKITSSCHIGIATLIPKSIAFKTAATASNKIYEYAACGLPILYYDNEHFNEYLSKHEWAFATDLSSTSLDTCLTDIMNNYDYYSSKAREDFLNKFNFEKVFQPLEKILEK